MGREEHECWAGVGCVYSVLFIVEAGIEQLADLYVRGPFSERNSIIAGIAQQTACEYGRENLNLVSF